MVCEECVFPNGFSYCNLEQDEGQFISYSHEFPFSSDVITLIHQFIDMIFLLHLNLVAFGTKAFTEFCRQIYVY